MTSLRSRTRTTPRKRYTIDAFDGIQDLVLQESDSGSDTEVEDEVEEDQRDEEEFRQEDDAPSEPDDDDSMSGLEELGPVEEVDDQASDAGEDDLDDSMSIAEDLDTPRKGGNVGGRRRRKPVIPEGQQSYVRGVPNDLHTRVNKNSRRKWIFGPTEKDYGPVFRARNKWKNQLCLPARKAKRNGEDEFDYNNSYRQEFERADENWKWYDEDGGREVYQERQVFKQIGTAEAQSYLPIDAPGQRSFIMGPIEKRQLYNMKVRQFVSLSEPFLQDRVQSKGKQAPGGKSGFIINLGARVQSLDWVPNQCGRKQYLAVSVLPKREADHPLFEAPEAPAFTPQSPFQSSIQIWEFSADKDNGIDTSLPPKLKLLLCTAIGDIKLLKWCPIPSKDIERIALLGCISGDGTVRVFDVARSAYEAEPTNILGERAAFEAKPPDTVCTSFTWLSSSRIAASCANGCVAVWDLQKASTSKNDNPRPIIYTSVSTTYIMTIASCWPTSPNLVATTSMNGYVMLTDLSRPDPGSPACTAISGRTRLGQPLVAWHDFSHCAISVEDNQTVRCYPIRRWFSSVGTARVKSHATSIAVSPCHPFVLFGTAAGEVVGNNPMRRLVDGGKSPLLQQAWFAHEWRRPNEDEELAAEESSGVEGTDVQAIIGKDGLSRITDGFKAQPVVLNSFGNSVNHAKNGVIFTTIYEEKSAITALAWNPNAHVGGWAAAGMADGLLRVEDIAF